MPRVWMDKAGTMTAAGGGGRDTIALTDALADRLDTRLAQMTLLRTIIGLNIGYAVHDSGEGSQLVSIGIGVVSQDAFNVAADAGIPNAELDADHPTRGWVWRTRYRVFGFAADQPAVFTQRVDMDIRSMRKLENGVSIMTITNEDIEGVSTTIQIHGLIRQLWNVG